MLIAYSNLHLFNDQFPLVYFIYEACHSAKAEDFPAWQVVEPLAMTDSCSRELMFSVSTGFRDLSLPDLTSVSLLNCFKPSFSMLMAAFSSLSNSVPHFSQVQNLSSSYNP